VTNAQKFLIYSHIGQLVGELRQRKNISIKEAFSELVKRGIIEQLSDISTGYYLESDAYLQNEFLGSEK
jgi:hypothetical protein